MTLKQTERLLQLLALHGVFHYKTAEIEVNRDASGGLQPTAAPPPNTAVPGNTVQRPLGDITPSQSTIPHHVNEVSALLKLDDFSLVDRLFPDHTQPSED